MNYAATLATAVVLAFCFPLVVRLGTALGIPAVTTAVILWTVLMFSAAALLIRWRVERDRVWAERLQLAREQASERPTDSQAYFLDGEHLALLLLRAGRRREATEVVDRYARLAGARDGEILALREALSSAEPWRFRRKEGTPAKAVRAPAPPPETGSAGAAPDMRKE